MKSPTYISVDLASGKDHSVVMERHSVGISFFRELTDGEDWTPHPSGGIIVTHPDRAPIWCRTGKDGYEESVIEPITSRTDVLDIPHFLRRGHD